MLKNKIIIITTALLLALPVYSEGAANAGLDDTTQAVTETVSEETDTQTSLTNENEPSIEESDFDLTQTPYKQPVSRKKIVMKFLLAMLGVAISSLVIYFGLAVYNRLRDGFVTSEKSEDLIPEDDKSLVTPQNMSDAVKTFVEKTHWE